MTKSDFSIALAGNPNAGKTSLFNALTGARQHVGNYPGVTVEKKSGFLSHKGKNLEIVDLPGTYSLTAYSLEELVARNYLIGHRPDVVVHVVDAANLERNLYLAVQLMELGVPLILCLNMIDVAENRGMRIDTAGLSRLLKVPVVTTVARTGKGVEELLDACLDLARQEKPWESLEISYGTDVDQGVEELSSLLQGPVKRQGLLSSHWVAVKLLEGDQEVMKGVDDQSDVGREILSVCDRISRHIGKTLDDEPESIIADYRYGFISAISRKTLTSQRLTRMDFSDKLDQVLTNRFFGPVFLLVVLYAVYHFVFWAGDAPVQWLGSFFDWMGGAVEAAMPEGVLRSLLISGVIDGVGGVLGFAPLILFMFFAIAFMEDTGYMARVAYLMDRILRAFGLHGNSVLPMIVGGGISGGCAVPGVMATRTLKDPKARLATILVVPLMNCGAKLPVYAILIAAFFSQAQAQVMFTLTIISWALALLAAKALRTTVLKGEQAPFVMELPPYRLPTFKGLLIHTWERTWEYVKKAGTVILGISILLWALMTFPGLDSAQREAWQAKIDAAPTTEARAIAQKELAQAELSATVAGSLGRSLSVITDPLGFDWRTNVALIGGVAAKEVIVSTLGIAYSLGETSEEESLGLSQKLAANPDWNQVSAFALMIFVMVYSPCFVTLIMIRKETGSVGWAAFATIYTTVLAYVLALIVNQGGKLLGL